MSESDHDENQRNGCADAADKKHNSHRDHKHKFGAINKLVLEIEFLTSDEYRKVSAFYLKINYLALSVKNHQSKELKGEEQHEHGQLEAILV